MNTTAEQSAVARGPRGHKFPTCVSRSSVPRGAESPTCRSSAPRGGEFPTCRSSVSRGGEFPTCRSSAPVLPLSSRIRPAFTLVELLVVIGIIAVLAGLVTPAVMRAQASARNAAIKAEIDMLHMAIMNYKNEYGSFPPAFDSTPLPPTPATASNIINRHLQRLFPRILSGPTPTIPDNRATAAQISSFFDTDAARNPSRETRALVPWLMGYTDDATDPIGNSLTPGSRNKLFDFDQSRLERIVETRSGVTVTSFTYHPSGKKQSPYVYLPASQYKALPYLATSVSSYGAHRVPSTPPPTSTTADFAYASLAAATAASDFANPDTFQILCAGRDEQFGTDDDLSNFWPGTRRDYLDSLNQ